MFNPFSQLASLLDKKQCLRTYAEFIENENNYAKH